MRISLKTNSESIFGKGNIENKSDKERSQESNKINLVQNAKTYLI